MLRQWGRIGKIKAAHAPDVRFWSLADMEPSNAMSALPPKADIHRRAPHRAARAKLSCGLEIVSCDLISVNDADCGDPSFPSGAS